MAEPITDKAEILANQGAFLAAVEHARATFGGWPGVIDVSYGLRQKDGVFGADFAIVILVEEKKRPEDVPTGQMIPPTFDGYATDVRIVPRVGAHTCDNVAKYETIQGGIQITNAGTSTSTSTTTGGVTTTLTTIQVGLGTIACIVRRRNDISRDNVYILSNHHVIYADGHGPGDYIYHPRVGAADAVSLGPIQSGGIEADIAFTPPGATTPLMVFADCAVARLDIDSKCCGSTCTKDTIGYAPAVIDLVTVTPPDSDKDAPATVANVIADVRSIIGELAMIGTTVTKVGRTTGKTQGLITSITRTFTNIDRVTHAVNYTGHNAIEISFDVTQTNCKGHAWFCEEGDSGSLILDAQNRAIGLLSQGPLAGAPPGSVSLACHIVPVLDQLNICIECASTGTSHGSAHATDGSGVAPSPLPPDPIDGSGLIAFAEDRGASRAFAVAPPPLNAREIDHMQALLARFRATPNGPALHAVFGDVRREVGYLVRNCRPVTVAWHRHHGPAFMTLVLNHLAGHADSVPHMIKGVGRDALLTRMRAALMRHGSNPLRDALTEHGDVLFAVLTDPASHSVCECLRLIDEGVAA